MPPPIALYRPHRLMHTVRLPHAVFHLAVIHHTPFTAVIGPC